ncbi:hypothetical protein [Sphingobium lignivorans]|uniref:Uncharacterized protein n=1 Tax=Sphingobium lignivorans TaxID=2735886 RepID=A0ABR6NIV2_9SPHN|nr:hypothetical protein [Sphingobium lignivorans]MBB5986557.1 hypothetical protein [Sphingobium lignivorans]
MIAWLSTPDFDPVRDKSVQGARPPKNGGRRPASTATGPMVRYMQEYELVISPWHRLLQRDFETFLKAAGDTGVHARPDRVDVRFRDATQGLVLAGITSTEPATVRFAIRAAIGQLLDFHQRAKGNPAKLIVIDDQPCKEDMELALVNGFGIAWRSGKSVDCRWPKGR